MPFKSSTVKTQPFARTNAPQSSQRSNEDLLIRVDSYDLGSKTLRGVDQTTQEFVDIQINPRAIKSGMDNQARAEEEARKEGRTIPWRSWSIDSDLAAHFPQGSLLVVDSASEVRVQTENGRKLRTMEAWRITNVQDDSPEKTFIAPITIALYKDRVFRAQAWQDQRILATDQAAMNALAERLDAIAEEAAQNQYPVTVGAQFVVIQEPADPKERCKVLDMSPTYDYISRERDETTGETTVPGRPLDGDSLLATRDEYINDYVAVKFPPEQYPGVFVEAGIYRNFKGSTFSRFLDVDPTRQGPMQIMSQTTSKLAMDDAEEDVVTEKNCATRGIMQITADKPDADSRGFITLNFLHRLHVNGRRMHVHEMLLTHDGRRCVMAEELRLKFPERKNAAGAAQGQSNGQSGYGSNARSNAPQGGTAQRWGQRNDQNSNQGSTQGHAQSSQQHAPAASHATPNATQPPHASEPNFADSDGFDSGNWGSGFDDMDDGNPFERVDPVDAARQSLNQAGKNFGH